MMTKYSTPISWKNVITILKQLTQDMIYFTEYKQEILDEIETITGCINNEEDSCADKKVLSGE